MRRIHQVAFWLLILASPVFPGPIEARAAPIRVSTGGVSAVVPPGWRRLGPQDGRLLFVSPGPGAEGVVIARGQAMILIAPLREWRPGADLRTAIRAEQGDDRLISRGTVRLAAGGGDCHEVEEVDTATEVGPGVEQINAGFYCVAHDRAVLLQLTHWPRDAARARFRAIALRTMRGLRLTP